MSHTTNVQHLGLRARLIVVLVAWAALEISNLLYWEMAPDLLLMETGALREPTFDQGVLMRVLALVPALFLPTRIEVPSQIAAWILYVSVYVSTLMFGPSVGMNDLSAFIPQYLVLTLSLFLLCMLGRLRHGDGIDIDVPRGTAISIMVVWTVVALAYSIATTGTLILATSYSDLYEFRAEFSDLTAGGRLLGYMLPPIGTIIAPLLIAWGVYTRRYWLLTFGLAAAILFTLQAAARAPVLNALITLVAAWLLSRRNGKGGMPGISIPVFLAFAGFAAYVIDNVTSFDQIAWDTSEPFFFRVQAVTGVISSLYFDFFSHNPPAYWSYTTGTGVFGWLLGFTPTYELPPARLIGATYFWGAATNANANFWFNGYAEARLFGTAFESALVIGYFYVLDRVARARNPAIVTAASISIAFSLSNVGATVALLSNGLGFLVVILLLCRPEEMTHPLDLQPNPVPDDVQAALSSREA